MKTFLLSIYCACLSLAVNGQKSRFGLGVEYSPNFTNATSLPFTDQASGDGYRLAQNVFLKADYKVSGKLSATAGLGYMDTRVFLSISGLSGIQDIFKIESHKFQHYVVVPVGFKYNIGSVYIHPEVALGWNTGNISLDTYYFGTPTSYSATTQRHKDDYNFYDIHKMTFPAFLSFGHDIPLKSITLSLGFKGYYSFNTIGGNYYTSRHAYGFGMVFGVRM